MYGRLQHTKPELVPSRDIASKRGVERSTVTDAMFRAKAREIAQRLQIPKTSSKLRRVGSRITSIVPISGGTSGTGSPRQAAMRTTTARTMAFISTSSLSNGSENGRWKRQTLNSRPGMPKRLTPGFRQSTLSRLLWLPFSTATGNHVTPLDDR